MRHNVAIRNIEIEEFYEGVYLYESSNNNISGNNIAHNGDGISLHGYSSNNSISGNNIAANDGDGIYLFNSSGNNISGNNINNITANNRYGIFLYYSSRNSVYHNNFANNFGQAYVTPPDYANAWDEGYPSGGNYWSDYSGTDLFSGPYQNETGTDGIGDTPYVIGVNNTDYYPLGGPWSQAHDVRITDLNTSKKTCTPFPTVSQNCTVSISLRIENQGSYSETFNVTIFANDIDIGFFENITLAFRNSAILSFVWDTTGFGRGNYTISAVVDPVPGEVNTENNEFHDCWILITGLGDINADQTVDIFDCV